MKTLLYALVLTSSLLATSSVVAAADTPAEKAAPAKLKAPGLPFRGKVSAIDKENRTVSLAGREKTRTYQVTDSTKIKKDGKPTTFDSVTIGESVGGYALRNETGHPEVVTLNLGKAAKGSAGGAEEKN